MPEYPETRLDREIDRAIAAENRRYLKALDDAGEGACPNCLRQGGGWCWACTDDQHPPRDPEAYRRANPNRKDSSK
jgi:hypothetical protein